MLRGQLGAQTKRKFSASNFYKKIATTRAVVPDDVGSRPCVRIPGAGVVDEIPVYAAIEFLK
jgi:hypothetical protein